MNSKIEKVGNDLLGKWVLATSIGWPVGLFLAFPLSYGIVNQFYPKETNLILGLCIGAGVGFAQWHAVRNYFKISAWWICASAVGMGLPFIMEVISIELSGGNPVLDDLKNDSWFGAIGGFTIGLLQFHVLRSLSKISILWIAVSSMAWGIAWLASIKTGAVGLFFLGGIVLGVITGIAIVWLLSFPVQGDIGEGRNSKRANSS